jgi:hypothetical protein
MSKQSLKYIPHFYFCGMNRRLLFTHYSGISSHSQGSLYNGQQDIAKFYDVYDEWTQSTRGSDTINNYYEWLLLVKTESKRDNIWISFVEGLHRHAAIIACLLCT